MVPTVHLKPTPFPADSARKPVHKPQNIPFKGIDFFEFLTSAHRPSAALELGELIDAGASGEVFLGKYAGQTVAIKRLFMKRVGKRDLKQMESEASILAQISHPNTIRFFGGWFQCVWVAFVNAAGVQGYALRSQTTAWSWNMQVVARCMNCWQMMIWSCLGAAGGNL